MLGPTRLGLGAALDQVRPYLQGASHPVKGIHVPPTSYLLAVGDGIMKEGPWYRAGVTENAGVDLWEGKSLGVQRWKSGCGLPERVRELKGPHRPPHSCAGLKGHAGPSS